MPADHWDEAEIAECEGRFLSDQERSRAAQEFVGALGQMARTEPLAKSLPIEKIRRQISAKPRAHPERDLEKACSDLLQFDGWRLLKTDPVSDRGRGKGFGEVGMADCLYIRYRCEDFQCRASRVELIWIEWKSETGKTTHHQRLWHAAERARGALTLIAGQDFPATTDGFLGWYRGSGLMRRKL